MNFTNDNANRTPLVDNVFRIASLAKEDAKINGDLVINATIGSLCGEDGKLAALETVYDSFREVPDRVKAGYAPAIKGDPQYLRLVKDWILQGHLCAMPNAAVATAGGTGAISAAISATTNDSDAVLIPDIAWGSYKIMLNYFHLKAESYPLFKGNSFDTESFERIAGETIRKQGRLTVVINDPCQNPTGYCMTRGEWDKIVEILNRISENGPVTLINDIAYIDYMKDLAHSRDHFDAFEKLGQNVAVVVAFSCSKSLTAYGMRLGAALLLSNNKDAVKELESVMERYCRSVWSNVNNGFMNTFTILMNKRRDEYLAEKAQYIKYLAKRAEIFTKEADACGLEYYPYKDGFFVTVKVEDPAFLSTYHEKLMEHHIYTVKVNKGIRVGLCSLSEKTASGLAEAMKKVAEEI